MRKAPNEQMQEQWNQELEALGVKEIKDEDDEVQAKEEQQNTKEETKEDNRREMLQKCFACQKFFSFREIKKHTIKCFR